MSADTKGQTESLLKVLDTDMSTPLPAAFTREMLNLPPFTAIEGTFNLRDSACRDLITTSTLKPGYAFRSGTLERLPYDSYEGLRRLGIKSIFDLRSFKETTEYPDPPVEGVEYFSVPSTLENETTIQAQKSAQEKEHPTLIGGYLTILETHKAIFKIVLQHIRNNPDKPFLFHCTAGKDRTGVLAYILHNLAGNSLDVTDLDYALTRVGVEPEREFLTSKLTGGGYVDLKDPKIAPYANVPVDGMSQFDVAFNKKYGGIQQYVQDVLQLTKQDIEIIMRHLTTL